MQREWHTEFFQKLSSTATPTKGRTVPDMDDIVDREMKGLTLDEDKLSVEPCFIGLIRRIFPALSAILPKDLNNAYCKVSTSTKAPEAQSSQRRSTRLEAHAPKPAAQSRSAKKLNRSRARKGIYDEKTKKWRWQEIVPREISAHINDKYFVHPFADSLAPQGGDESESGQAARGTDTDIEDVGTSSAEGSSFLDGRPRKGAAYDGDSSKDEDYFSGKGAKKRKPLVENLFAGFLNALAASVSEHDFGHNGHRTQGCRWWYGDFSVKKLDSLNDEPRWSRKPDLILLEGQGDGPITWKSLKALGEFTFSTLAANKTLVKMLNTKAYLLLSSQPWRRYILAISFADFQMRLHFYDRSGAQVSSPINFHRDLQPVVEVIHAFAYADRDLLGYDPTIDIHRPPSIPKQISFHGFIGTIISGSDILNIISLLSSSSGFIGRGTVCWHVRPVDTGPGEANEGKLDNNDYVLKDNWVDEELIDHEIDILSHIAGIKGVPVLVKSWTVQYKGEDDTTLRYRPAAWKRLERFVNRVHRRQLLRPVGSPLSTFRSQKELLLGLIAGLESVYFVRVPFHLMLTPNSSPMSY